IYEDNTGYGDYGCFGSTVHRTPHTDRMCAEGMKFTDFYSTSGVCTPSRASIMTGCYPRRVNMHVSDKGGAVLQPVAKKGLNPDEITVARLLKDQGYATACIGKWHLGDQAPFLPTRHGFDLYLGIPYSDDMTAREQNPEWPPLPLMRDEEVIDAPVDRDYLTRRYTEEAVRFIKEHKDEPFFVYVPLAMPGSTKRPYASPDFQGKSANGPYGDSIEEMDWCVGQILDTLDELGLDDNTLVVKASDNGAVRHDPMQGSNLPLKGWGYDTSEGGQRVPCIMRWPGRIPPGSVCGEIATTMDILPTLARLAGAEPPRDRIIDGQDLSPILAGDTGAGSGYDEAGFFYYMMDQLQAVRSGPWKLYLPIEKRARGRQRESQTVVAELYDLREDIGETEERSDQHPDVVARLMALADRAREDLGDLDREGSGQRPCGWVDNPVAQVM
ncbi:MAG: sulfatase-like hydrolase/transferase, partial [Candidatus Latescibacteria bacterium]|nr:sulfatase-like hydrolase/transferase [Candidatus Latescibacterota bacterium]